MNAVRIVLAGLLTLSLLCATPIVVRADRVIRTDQYWNDFSYVDPFGYGGSATYGQSFLCPQFNSVLQSFTFNIKPISATSAMQYQVMIYQWNRSFQTAVGAPVFTSPTMTTAGLPTAAFTAVTVNTNDLQLMPTQRYIVFFTCSPFWPAGITDVAEVGYPGKEFDGRDVYDSGGFFYLNNQADTTAFTGQRWLSYVGHGKDDIAFELDFTSPTAGVTTNSSSAHGEEPAKDKQAPGVDSYRDIGDPMPVEPSPAERQQQLADPYAEWEVTDDIATGRLTLEPPAYIMSGLPDADLFQPGSAIGSISDSGIEDALGLGLQQDDVPGVDPDASFAGFTRIYNSMDYPYRTMCKIDSVWSAAGIGASGSGILISPKYLLTAAHCVFNRQRLFPNYIVVRPGLSGTNEPYGRVSVNAVHTFIGWIADENLDFDMALLTLGTPVGNSTGWDGYTSVYTDGQTGNIGGYPGFQDFGLGLYFNSGPTQPRPRSSGFRVDYPMNGPPGMSGSGVYAAPVGSTPSVFGVHSTFTPPPGSAGTGTACRITNHKFFAIYNWILSGV